MKYSAKAILISLVVWTSALTLGACDSGSGPCNLEDIHGDTYSTQGCEHIIGYLYNNDDRCAYAEPVYIGCYDNDGPVSGAYACYLSPEKNIVVPRENIDQPGMQLLHEGWTEDCGGTIDGGVHPPGVRWCESWD
jgi:hypothetical protein